MQKVIFFDLDGTLTPDSTWLILNQKLGITSLEDQALFERYLDKTLEYRAWTTELFRLHKERGMITKDEVIALADDIAFRPDAISTLEALKEKGYHIVLLSGSVDTIVQTIAQKLGLHEWLACSQLVFDTDGVLSGIKSIGDEADAKLTLATQYLSDRQLTVEDALVIGDGGNEEALFKVMKGILLGSNKKLAPLAWKQVENLAEIKELL